MTTTSPVVPLSPIIGANDSPENTTTFTKEKSLPDVVSSTSDKRKTSGYCRRKDSTLELLDITDEPWESSPSFRRLTETRSASPASQGCKGPTGPKRVKDDQKEKWDLFSQTSDTLSLDPIGLDNLIGAVKIDKQKTPFRSRTEKVTVCEALKMVIMFPVALIRLVLIILVVILCVVWSNIFTMCHPKEPDQETEDLVPHGPCRRFMLTPITYAARLVMFIMGFVYVHEKGCCACSVSSRFPPVIVSNHVNFVDPIFLFYKFFCCTAASSWIARVPLLGTMLLAFSPILVDRNSPEGRSRAAAAMRHRPRSRMKVTDDEMAMLATEEKALEDHPHIPHLAAAAQLLQKRKAHELKLLKAAMASRQANAPPWPPMLVFPEGTTSTDNTMMAFKAGAFLSGMPVQPVLVRYPHCFLDTSWVVSGWGLVFLFFRMLCQVYNCMEVTYLDVYEPSKEEEQDAQLYADNVRAKMFKVLCGDDDEARMVPHTYDDVRLQDKVDAITSQDALRIDLGSEFCVGQVQQLLKFDFDTCVKLIKKFRAADTTGTGTIRIEDFAKAMDLDVNALHTRSVFRLLDTEGTGAITVRAMFQGLAVVRGNAGLDEKLKLVFRIYDLNGDGLIQDEELKSVMQRKPLVPDEENGQRDPDSPHGSPRLRFMTDTEVALACTEILGNSRQINFDEFKALTKEQPRLVTIAMHGLENWLKGVISVTCAEPHETRTGA